MVKYAFDDVGFDIWFTDDICSKLLSHARKGNVDELRKLLHSAFNSGYSKGVVDYSMSQEF